MSPKNSARTRTDLLLGGRRTSRGLTSNQLWGCPAIQMSIFGRFAVNSSPSPATDVEPTAQDRVPPTSPWGEKVKGQTLTGTCCVNLVPCFGRMLSPAMAHALPGPKPRHPCPAFVRSSSISAAVPVSERATRQNRLDCAAGIPNDRLLVF